MVGEEQPPVVAGGVGTAGVEGDAGDRRAVARQTVLAADDRRAMNVGVVGRRCGPVGVERVAEVEVRALVAGRRRCALIAGPTEVLHRAGRADPPVDLLPCVPSDVADPQLARARPEGEAEGVAQTHGDDPPGVRIRAAGVRAVREAGARGRVDAKNRSVEYDWLGGGSAQALAAQSAALGRGRSLRPSNAGGRIAARILRRRTAAGATALPVVRERPARTIAAGYVERAVGTEVQGAD